MARLFDLLPPRFRAPRQRRGWLHSRHCPASLRWCAIATCTRSIWSTAAARWCCSIGSTRTLRIRSGIWRAGPPTGSDDLRMELLGWLYDYVCLLWSELYLNLRRDDPQGGISSRIQLLAA